MKKMILSLLAIAAMTSCTTTSEDEIDPNAPVEIQLNAGVTALSRTIIKEGTAFDAQVVATETTATYGTLVWTTENAGNITVGSDKTVTFNPIQYYPANGSSIYMKGFAPRGTVNEGKVDYTITGDEDIIITEEISGSKTDNTNKVLAFQHLLTQLQIFVKASDDASIDAWGDIISIEVKEATKKLTLDINSGTIAANTTPEVGKLQIKGFTAPQTITTSAVKVGYIMLLPSTTAYTLIIKTAQNTDGVETTITPATTIASKAHQITLTFQGSTITPTATVGEWEEVPGGSGTIK